MRFTAMKSRFSNALRSCGVVVMVATVAMLTMVTEGNAQNPPPIANAGPDRNAKTGVAVLLDGSDSYDPSGGLITFHWSIIHAPAGSAATIDPIAPQPSFTPDLAGDYIFELQVTNGVPLSATDQIMLSAWNNNAPPNARPGRDRTGKVNQTIALDGSQSFDPEGTTLTFAWSFTAVPSSSAPNPTISGPTTATPTFSPYVPGVHTLQLQVSDGNATNAATVSVTVYAGNAAPMANAGPDQSKRDATFALDGSASVDPDAGPTQLTYIWHLVSRPAGSALTTASIVNATTATPSIVLDVLGAYVLRLEVSDGQYSAADNVVVSLVPNRPPVAVDDTATTQMNQSVDVDVRTNDYDPDGDSLTVTSVTQGSSGATSILPNGSVRYVPNAGITGHDEFNYTVNDGHGASATAKVGITITPTNQPPIVSAGANATVILPASAALAGTASDDGLPNPPGHLTLGWSKVSGPGNVTFVDSTAAATGASFSQVGTYVLRLTASDGALSATSDVTITVLSLPPDPSTVAPPLDPTVSTSIADATRFLYTGGNPIQTGVAANTIDSKRAAVIRGKVLAQDGQPLAGVKLTILGHPEFGQTLSRADGRFDLAVNGGSALTVVYQRDPYISVQRQVDAPWRDWVTAPDVMMMAYDTAVTAINLGQPAMQTARGNTANDSDGTRRATLFFPQGTSATMTLPNGTTQALSTISVRASEFTVGPNGPMQMPASLPPTSGYTYALELSVDEAVNAGASVVNFSQPVPFYVENFLNFPVGMAVPTGYFDRGRGVWVPSDNGRVIKVASITNGRANLIVNTNGTVATPTELAALGITDAEQVQLAGLYASGQSLWRVPITHFSAWDCNWPFGPPPGSEPPGQPPPTPSDNPQDEPNCKGGSIIDCQNQALRERLGLTGTPFTLYYASDAVPGFRQANMIEIPLSGAILPTGLKRIELMMHIAGKQYTQTFAAVPNQKYLFTWDRKDAYGRTTIGRLPVRIDIGYVYDAVYQSPAALERSFAQFSGILTGSRARREVTLHQATTTSITGGVDKRSRGLGAWSFNIHHDYDVVGEVLHLGDGSRRSAQSVSYVIIPVAGNGRPFGYGGDGGPATSASIDSPWGLAFDAVGNLYIADDYNARIRKVDQSGIITTVAGNGTEGFGGDGGPATGANLLRPFGIAFDPAGNLYIADTNNNRIRKVDGAGTITTVAGSGTHGFGGDGGPAILAALGQPFSIVIDAGGNLYISDSFNIRVRKVDPAGIISTVAGNGVAGFGGDGGPATSARLRSTGALALDASGNLYISDPADSRVRKVNPAGIITTVAGNGTLGYSGDGGSAVLASFYSPVGVAVDSSGNLYIADQYGGRIRKVNAAGIITTIAGSGGSPFSGDGGPPILAGLEYPAGLAINAAGNLYIGDIAENRVLKISPSLPAALATDIAVPSTDGGELYVFDSVGRHQRTVNALTGAILYQFSYDAAGRLAQVQDGTGNNTMIARDANGNPVSITGPDGQVTALSVDGNGYLAFVTNPMGESTQITYSADGLLTEFKNPRGYASTMQYDNFGHLLRDEGAAGNSWTLSRTQTGPNFTVSMASALGRTTTYRVDELSTSDQRRTNTYPDGTVSQTLISANSIYATTAADGTVTKLTQGPDPRFSMQAPIPVELKITTPASLVSTTTTTSTVSLSDPNNLLSLTSSADVVKINGRTYTSVYNAAQKQFTTTSPVGRQSLVSIDGQGHVLLDQVTGVDALNYTYDARGRLTGITQGTGANQRTSTLSYNAQGYVGSITDTAGRVVSFAYDLAGRVTVQTLPDGRIIQYAYDADGNVAFVTPPSRPAHAFSYTPVDLEQSYTPPSVAGAGTISTSYQYNADKQLTQVTRPDSQSATLGYDSGGRLATLTTPAGVTSYAYQPTSGQINSIAAPGGIALAYSYDGFLPTSESWSGPVSGAVTRSYNADFNVTGLTAKGNSVTFAYDQDRLLTQAGSLSISRSATTGLITGSTLSAATTTQSYNSFGELQNLSASYSGSPLYSATYTRDNLGRITQKVEAVQGTTDSYAYSYDTAGRLVQAVKNGTVIGSYTYDANGNRVMANALSATYDNQDRLVTYAGASYAYTANGELITKSAGGQTTQYSYDVLGNLRNVTLPNGTVIEYLIDGRNRRVGKKVNGALMQAFLYQDALNPVAELDAGGAVVSRFVYGTRPNVPDYMVKGGVTYRIVSDYLGSPRLVVSTANGTVAQRIDYDEFGVITFDSNSGFQPFGFAGGIYDKDTQLPRFGARDYDAQIGRWTAKDPIAFGGGDSNLMAYVGGNPISLTDPTGLDAMVCLYSGAGGFGHVGIGVSSSSTVGFYPQKDGPGMVTGSPGETKRDTKSPQSCKRIETSPAQDKRMSDFMRGAAMPPAVDYTLASNNCVNFVRQVLNQAGIQSPDTIKPKPFFNGLPGSPNGRP